MNILDAIVKYNHGIIGTLAVHMILFVWFNVENMSFTVINPKEKVVAVLDYLDDSPQIEITGIDDIGLVNEITSLISNSMNVNMNRISFETNDGLFSGVVSVEVENKVILNKLMKRLKAIKGLEKVIRR